MKEGADFSGVTHYTQVDVQPGGINIQNVEHLYQADILKQLGIELAVKDDGRRIKDDGRCEREGKPTFFVHPTVGADEQWLIHDEIVRLVARQGIQEICKYLTQLSDDKKVLLPQNAEKAYNELVRLGMPDGEGFSLKTFTKYYKR
jgi:hypothetical protein